jgi:hypothetical protein
MNTTNRLARKRELLFIILDLSFFTGISVGILFCLYSRRKIKY